MATACCQKAAAAPLLLSIRSVRSCPRPAAVAGATPFTTRHFTCTPARHDTGPTTGQSGDNDAAAKLAQDAAILGSGDQKPGVASAPPPATSTPRKKPPRPLQAWQQFGWQPAPGLSQSTNRRAQKAAEAEAYLAKAKRQIKRDPKSWTHAKTQELLKQPFLGPRRRRAAILTTGDVPFEQLPYQCFQEARKIIAADRREKIAQIRLEAARLRRLAAADPSTMDGGEARKRDRLAGLRRSIEELKIMADINDPLVKRRFEDGMGDFSKPIYRYLARRRWFKYDYLVTCQRVEQFNIVPDLLPKFNPAIDVKMIFKGLGRKMEPGAIVATSISELPPTLRVQVFDRGERLFTIAVVDSDVPDPSADGFTSRCHFLVCNVPWDPTKILMPLHLIPGVLDEVNKAKKSDPEGGDAAAAAAASTATPATSSDPTSAAPEGETRGPSYPPFTLPGQVAVPWLPPFSLKGSRYHRLSLFIFAQPDNLPLDAAVLREAYYQHPRDEAPLRPENIKTKPPPKTGTGEEEEPLAAQLEKAMAAAAAKAKEEEAANDGQSPAADSIEARKAPRFTVKAFRSRFGVKPVGFAIFRTVWDDTTEEVMRRHGYPGADVEFVPRRIRSTRPPKKARGWEAKRQGPKYKHLWKYSKRINW